MSTLTDRLRGIVGGAVPRMAPELRGSDSAADTAAEERSARTVRGLDQAAMARAAAELGGHVAESGAGATIMVDRHYAPEDRHGRVTIGEIVETLENGGDGLALLASAYGPDRHRLAEARSSIRGEGPRVPLWFLDLETTGLAGGAGTQAFLVGCAWFDEGGIAVRQFLLPGFEHERALLAEVAAWAATRGAIVSFNGRSFDVPLIETRYLFHRQVFPLEGRPHMDMLHPSRRLWRARGEWTGSSEASCSLSTLEKLLAGVHRVGDVPGFEIPSRYFQFVRDGDARPLEAVLEHNRIDLVSLALVMARAVTLLERGPSAARSAYECVGLARIYDRAGQGEEAEAAYVQGIAELSRVGRDPESLADALRRLAYCRRRAGRWREAAEAWQTLADLPQCPVLLRHEAREALAIHHEHRARDLSTAHAHARHLLDGPGTLRRREAAEHRLRRLERKIRERNPAPTLWGDERV